VILEKRVSEGQPVQRGDVLYVISSERRSSTQGDTQARISQHVEGRERSLRDELANTRQLQQEEQRVLAGKVAALRAEQSNLDDQIKGQRTRVQLVQESLARHTALAERGLVSKEVLQQKQVDALDQQARLKSLERDRITVARELQARQADLNGLGLMHNNQLAPIERDIMGAEEELTESEARRRLVVTAPASGTATAVMAEVGQVADPTRPLVSIVPTGAKLRAHLYVPSKAVGFVKPGDAVLLRYQAYPYQKFGHYRGIVATVSRTALFSNELTDTGMPWGAGTSAANEPMYRVTVDLASQSVYAYGRPQQLQSGMLLEADLLQDKRRLYEWVLEPLHSLSGKL
jgi:membrane fusion protein